MSLLGNFLPASFRGVPFAVVDQSVQTGRRVAMHEYPGRDTPWAEDMGRSARRWRFRGFLLEDDQIYGGGPIEVQRLAILAAAEGKGSGLLIHPTLGLLMVECEQFALGEGIDGATYSTVEWSFVESGSQSLPSLLVSSFGVTGDLVTAVALTATAARKLGIGGSGASGSANGVLPQATAAWSDKVISLGSDATALHRLASSLPGNFGRYSRGATTGFLTQVDTSTTDTLPQLIELAAEQRTKIATAAADLQGVVAALTVSTTEEDYANAAASLISALTAACADPADALRLLAQLLGFTPLDAWADTSDAAAVADTFQRLAAIEFARVVGTYQPASYDDAFDHLVWATGILDTAITEAGDAGQDDLYSTLRELRVEVVTDLTARGASLAHVKTFTAPRPLPAIVLAQRYYRDPARADELVGQVPATVSPLFMPTTMKALA